MIALQNKLQKLQLDPSDASAIVESIMKECVDLRQSDMAHLLFRASLRFRKYGLKLSYVCVKHLYDSYRAGSAKDMMGSLADEIHKDLEGNAELRPLVLGALIFAEQYDKATALKDSIPPAQLTTEDLCAMIEAYGSKRRFNTIVELLNDAHCEASFPSIDPSSVYCAAICCLRGDVGLLIAAYKNAVAHRLKLSETALGYVFRALTYDLASVADVCAVEERMKSELGIANLGLFAETSMIAKCSEFISKGQAAADEIMLAKVHHLQAVVETSLQNDNVEDLDVQYLNSLIKGFGIMGKLDDMRKAFDILKQHNAANDNRIYEEMLKWYAYNNNVKEVLALKEEMTVKNIYHTSAVYNHVFRVLDRFYPRMVEKYYLEMQRKNIVIEPYMYPTLLRIFGELQDHGKLEELYAEIRARISAGNSSLLTPRLTCAILRAFHHDPHRCEKIISEAGNMGHLSEDRVQSEILQYYFGTQQKEKIEHLISSIPRKSAFVFQTLLRETGRHGDRAQFDKYLEELRNSGEPMTERLLSIIITSQSRFGNRRAVEAALQEAKDGKCIRTSQFFADAAAAFARLGDSVAIEMAWNDLIASDIPIAMPVYNKFLDLYMATNQLDKVQQVLNMMMQKVPPNPITTTTVIDMLGKMGRLSEMEALLEEMTRSTNAKPTLVTYHQVMSAYAKSGDVHKMEAIRFKIREAEMQENHVTYNILAEGYGRAKRYEHLKELLQERAAKKIPLEEFGFIILLNTYARARMPDEVGEVSQMLLDSGIPLTSRMLSTVATAYSLVGDTGKVEHYVNLLMNHKERRQRDIESVFLMYSRLRDVTRLQQLFDSCEKTEFVYNICVGAFAKAGQYNKVAQLLQHMEQKGFELSRNTSVTLSSLLMKAGKLELARAVLDWKGRDRAKVERSLAETPPVAHDPEAFEAELLERSATDHVEL